MSGCNVISRPNKSAGKGGCKNGLGFPNKTTGGICFWEGNRKAVWAVHTILVVSRQWSSTSQQRELTLEDLSIGCESAGVEQHKYLLANWVLTPSLTIIVLLVRLR